MASSAAHLSSSALSASALALSKRELTGAPVACKAANGPAAGARKSQAIVCEQKSEDAFHVPRRDLLLGAGAAAAWQLLPGLTRPAFAGSEEFSSWEPVPLPVEPGVVLLDIAFVPGEPNHGRVPQTEQVVHCLLCLRMPTTKHVSHVSTPFFEAGWNSMHVSLVIQNSPPLGVVAGTEACFFAAVPGRFCGTHSLSLTFLPSGKNADWTTRWSVNKMELKLEGL